MTLSTFHSLPSRIFVTVATEVEEDRQPQQEFQLTPEFAHEDGILIVIEKPLHAGRPLKILLVPEEAPSGTLTMATPDDFTFSVPVATVPPSHIHLTRIFEEGNNHITCLIPLFNTDYVNLESIRRNILDALDTNLNEDGQAAHYFGELMVSHHVLSLDYTPGVTENYEFLQSIDVMFRHFCPSV